MYRLRAYIDFDWVAPGTGGAAMSTLEANNPGLGPSLGPGTTGIAQSLRIQQAEQIFTTTALSAVTSGQISTALTQLATDLLAQVNSATNTSTGTTPLSQMQGWATGAQ